MLYPVTRHFAVALLASLAACSEAPVRPGPAVSARLAATSAPAPEPVAPPATYAQPPYGQPAPGGGAALEGAKQKVRDLNLEISRAESERRQLSPPIRITDARGTTFDQDKQARYDREVARLDRRIAELRREKTLWELRVNELSR
ncbi:MAG: hypothetical protein JSR82_02335 [Verrucomicrobia bacterium]|nr:hypothetical protein [Verrucomicrobiota bacterium]